MNQDQFKTMSSIQILSSLISSTVKTFRHSFVWIWWVVAYPHEDRFTESRKQSFIQSYIFYFLIIAIIILIFGE